MTLNALFIFSLIGGCILMLAVPSLPGIVTGAAIIVASFAVFLCGLSVDVRDLRRALAKMRESPHCPCRPQIDEIREAVSKLGASQAKNGDGPASERE